MNTPNDGGPAFPGKTLTYPRGNGFIEEQPTLGMSLRDYFAGQALVGLLASGDFDFGVMADKADAKKDHLGPELLAYPIADAMLAARDGKEDA